MMKNFLLDMFIGWVIYTKEGKQFVSRMGDKLTTYATKEISKKFKLDDFLNGNEKTTKQNESTNIITNICNFGDTDHKENSENTNVKHKNESEHIKQINMSDNEN